MKNKCKFIWVVTFVTLFLFYRVDSYVAMAAAQNVELTVMSGAAQNEKSADNPGTARKAESAEEPESEQNAESADNPGTAQKTESAEEPKPGQSTESADDSGTEQNGESAEEPKPGQSTESADDSGTEQNGESAEEPKPGQSTESADDSGTEQNGESAEEPKPGQSTESADDSGTEQNGESTDDPESEQNGESTDDPESEQNEESAAGPGPKRTAKSIVKPAAESDSEQSVSTGSALIEWLESHKETGGNVKLTDNVVWDEDYSYCPNGTNRPSVFVDTDKFTITITGEVELLSDNHLTFSGHPDGKGIFYVAEKGALSMQGVAVESGKCALWQEEGAGLVIEVDDCRISGSIHYADTPFVMYENSVCVVVEKGQTLNDVLPTQIYCVVNRQGQISSDEPVMLSWNPEGTETQQEERRRFELEGSFVDAASAGPVLCTVAYNDYPLTFTDVEASVSGSTYLFKGWYTKPEEYLPISVMAEYSFDGENWFMYEERSVSNTDEAFFIAIKARTYNMAAHSNIYIRLRWNDNGTSYFSNVLCYAADDLKHVEDTGGSRGGGTSIINPPDEPHENIDKVSSEEEPAQSAHRNNNSGDAGSETMSDTEQTETEGADLGADAQVPNVSASDTEAKRPLYVQIPDTEAKGPLYAESEADAIQGMNHNDSQALEKEEEPDAALTPKEEEAAAALAAYEKNNDNLSQINMQTSRADGRQGYYIVIAIGFVLLSVIAGIAGFCVHSRSGTNR